MKLVWKQWWSWNNRSAGAHQRVNRCQRLLRARTLCSTLLPLTNALLCSALNLLHCASAPSAWPLCPSETLLSPFPHIQLELLEREEYSANVNCKEPHGFSFLWQRTKMLDNKRITQALVSPCHSLSGANVPLGVLSDIWEPTSFYISTWWLRCHNGTLLHC